MRRRWPQQPFEAPPDRPRLQGGPSPNRALLLIDCQEAFLSGYWAQAFGLTQVAPIQRAFAATEALLASPSALEGCAVLCTKCYTDGAEAAFPPRLRALLEGVPCVWKPTTDVTLNPLFHDWLRERLSAGVHTLVLGGCTTTSCVRVSSQAILRDYAETGVRIVVDRSLCAAREDNYMPIADQDPDLVRIYGAGRCRETSPVELAELQMRSAGVEIVDSFAWPGFNLNGAAASSDSGCCLAVSGSPAGDSEGA